MPWAVKIVGTNKFLNAEGHPGPSREAMEFTHCAGCVLGIVQTMQLQRGAPAWFDHLEIVGPDDGKPILDGVLH